MLLMHFYRKYYIFYIKFINLRSWININIMNFNFKKWLSIDRNTYAYKIVLCKWE